MKVLTIIIVILLMLTVVGLLAYQGFVTKDLESGDIFRAVLILAGLVLTLTKIGKRKRVSNKKVAYEKAYPDYIQNVFSLDQKLEKLFFNAVDDYNRDKPAAAIEKLERLRKDCQRSSDLYAVTVFTALCLDDMRAYEKAIEQYTHAIQIKPNSTLYSNMGLCCERAGQLEKAIDAYNMATRLDGKNAFPLNNLGTLYYREGNYEGALHCAQLALEVNPRMPQALNLAAICSALLEDTAGYETYYRRAVAAGSDGRKIKDTIRSMRPEL